MALLKCIQKNPSERTYVVRNWLKNFMVGSVMLIHISMLFCTIFSFNYWLLSNHLNQMIMLPVLQNRQTEANYIANFTQIESMERLDVLSRQI
jgi:hypothetical protein